MDHPSPVRAKADVEPTPPTGPDYDVWVTVTPVTPDSFLGRPTCLDTVALDYRFVLRTDRDTLRLGYAAALVENGWRLLQADPDIQVIEGRDWSYRRSGEEVVGRTPYPKVRLSYRVVPDDCVATRDGFGVLTIPDGPGYTYVDPDVRRRRIREDERRGGDRSFPIDPDVAPPIPSPGTQRPPPEPPPPPPPGSR